MTDGEQNDFAAFEQQHLNGGEPALEPDAPDEPESGDEAGDEADPIVNDEAPEGDGEPQPEQPAKRKQSAQERIDEVTRARREAERVARDAAAEAKYWREVAEGKRKPDRQQEREDQAPNPDDFDLGETDPAYIDARIEYGIAKGLDKVRSGVAQDLHIQAEERAWEAKIETARSKFADFDQVVQTHDPDTGAAKWPCTREMAQAIRTSDAAGDLTYHLASNPEEARRIAALDPFSQVRELGRLEARLDAPAQPAPAKTTNAPKPPEAQARGAGGKFEASSSTTDFAQFEAMANRKT